MIKISHSHIGFHPNPLAPFRKWDTYMAGEDLFGLPQNNYPELRKTKKELELLEKLYTLYIVVIQKVNGYADLLWTELDFQVSAWPACSELL